MNLNWRIVSGNHIAHENTDYARSFSVELEVASESMHPLLATVNGNEETDRQCANAFANQLVDTIKVFYTTIALCNGVKIHFCVRYFYRYSSSFLVEK